MPRRCIQVQWAMNAKCMTFYLSPIELQSRVTGESQQHRDGAHRHCRSAQGGRREERLRHQGCLARAAGRGERNAGECFEYQNVFVNVLYISLQFHFKWY